ncbi:MAG: hypothetical protein AAF989_02740, partial [Planctomycetota bacterium]
GSWRSDAVEKGNRADCAPWNRHFGSGIVETGVRGSKMGQANPFLFRVIFHVAPPPMTASPVPEPLPTTEPPSGGSAALVASLLFHMVLLTTVGLLLSRRSSGTGAPREREIGIAMVHRLPDRDQYVDVAEVEPDPTEAMSADSSSSASAPPPASVVPQLDLAGVFKDLTDAPSPTSGTGLAGDNPLDGEDFDGGVGTGQPTNASKKKASLFGVSGYGSRFVYVMDRSDSMNGYGGRPLRAAQSELSRSLGTLSDQQQFQIVFYNENPKPFQFGATVSLITGDSATVTAAQQYVRSVRAFGGTGHEAALKMALRMRPDVIFFLTDARIPRLSSSQLTDIRVRAARAGTTIHSIEFGADPAAPTNSFLIDLARQNSGQYQYVDVRKL